MRRLVVACALASLSTAAEAATYTVRWTAVKHVTSPEHVTVATDQVDLFSVDGGSITTVGSGAQAVTAFGQAARFQGDAVTSYTVSYAPRGRDILQTFAFPGFGIRVAVRPDGRGACSARVAYSRLAGRAAFSGPMLDGRTATSSSMEAANVTCRVSGA